MPNVILDRISLPNLKLYTSVSVLLVSCGVYYAISATSDPFWRLDNNVTTTDSFFSLNVDAVLGGDSVDNHHQTYDANNIATEKNEYEGSILSAWISNTDNYAQQSHKVVNQLFSHITPDQRKLFNDTRTIGTKFKDVVSFMVQEPICIWVSSFNSEY